MAIKEKENWDLDKPNTDPPAVKRAFKGISSFGALRSRALQHQLCQSN